MLRKSEDEYRIPIRRTKLLVAPDATATYSWLSSSKTIGAALTPAPFETAKRGDMTYPGVELPSTVRQSTKGTVSTKMCTYQMHQTASACSRKKAKSWIYGVFSESSQSSAVRGTGSIPVGATTFGRPLRAFSLVYRSFRNGQGFAWQRGCRRRQNECCRSVPEVVHACCRQAFRAQ